MSIVDVEEKILLLGLEEYINCFLVKTGVRNGYLFQTINFKEYNIEDPISSIKLKKIKDFFPYLHHLPNSQGVLISLKQYTLSDIDTDSKLGKILGFPCEIPEEITSTRYSYNIKVIPSTTIDEDHSPVSIISFVSVDDNHKDYVIFLTDTIREILTEDIELSKIVKDVVWEDTVVYSANYFVTILMNKNHLLTEKEITDIENYWYNTVGEYRIYEFRYMLSDSVLMEIELIRGLIIGLLLHHDHSPLTPFFPVQNYGKQLMREVEKKYETFADQMLDIMCEYKTQIDFEEEFEDFEEV